MDEYIKKADALQIIEKNAMWNRSFYALHDDIEDMTAADVVPVRHGRWKWHEEWNNSTTEHYAELESCGWYCSHCGIELGDYLTKRTGETIYLDDEHRKPFLNRCPNCGWIMDLEDEDHE